MNVLSESTATYNAVFDHEGELLTAVADMTILEKLSFPKDFSKLPKSGPVCIDANMSVEHMREVIEFCTLTKRILIFEPTSVPKSCKIFDAIKDFENRYDIIVTPNYDETIEMAKRVVGSSSSELSEYLASELCKDIPKKLLVSAGKLLTLFDKAVIKLGPKGVLLGQKDGRRVAWHYFKPQEAPQKIISVTGAGDSMVGSLISALCRVESSDILGVANAVKSSMKASMLSIQSPRAVSQLLTHEIFKSI